MNRSKQFAGQKWKNQLLSFTCKSSITNLTFVQNYVENDSMLTLHLYNFNTQFNAMI